MDFKESLSKNALARAGERGITHAVIFSHDLDPYNAFPLKVRRDLGINQMHTMYVDPDRDVPFDYESFEGEQRRPVSNIAGLRFNGLFGNKVKGAFCPGTALILDGFFDGYTPYEHSLAIIQLVPDFAEYRSMCSMVGAWKGHEIWKGLAQSPGYQQIAEHLSDHYLKHLGALLIACAHLKNSPFHDAVHLKGRYPSPDNVMESLFPLCMSYSFLKFSEPTLVSVGMPTGFEEIESKLKRS